MRLPLLALCASLSACASAQSFTVTLPPAHAKPEDGRLLLLLSNDPSAEPRMQINDTPASQIVFGQTVDRAQPGTAIAIQNPTGYPIRTLAEVPEGDYTIRNRINRGLPRISPGSRVLG